MIRKAKENDAKFICDLAEILHIGKKGVTLKGFLVYVLPESGYFARIRLSKYFYVSENNNLIDGFLMSYNSKTLKDMQKKRLLSHEDGIMQFVSNLPEPYIFADQIGVNPKTQQKGIGLTLWHKLFADMKKNKINVLYGAILHKPICNKHSIDYHRKLGFVQVSEVKNKDNNIWGIYKYSI